ncbi:MAG: MarR family transcriptional regulator [Ruminococcaceae bacterium]|nr:MarR family transcriptional regulator [Oscillospiraceae bacterium]
MAGVMRNINVIYRCSAINRKQNSKEGLDGIYHSYIIAIFHHPGFSQDKLSRHICVSKSSVTRHLAFLEEHGYIERRQGEDKREMLVFPTEKLEKAYTETYAISKEWRERITADLSDEEKELAARVLEKMAFTAREVIFGAEDEE